MWLNWVKRKTLGQHLQAPSIMGKKKKNTAESSTHNVQLKPKYHSELNACLRMKTMEVTLWVGSTQKCQQSKSEWKKQTTKQKKTKKSQQHADLCLLLNVHLMGTTINHTNGHGQRPTCNICLTRFWQNKTLREATQQAARGHVTSFHSATSRCTAKTLKHLVPCELCVLYGFTSEPWKRDGFPELPGHPRKCLLCNKDLSRAPRAREG